MARDELEDFEIAAVAALIGELGELHDIVGDEAYMDAQRRVRVSLAPVSPLDIDGDTYTLLSVEMFRDELRKLATIKGGA